MTEYQRQKFRHDTIRAACSIAIGVIAGTILVGGTWMTFALSLAIGALVIGVIYVTCLWMVRS